MPGLTLSRREGQTISINHGEIRITVVDIRQSTVRLNIDAPRSMNIVREEIDRYTDGRQEGTGSGTDAAISPQA